MKLKRPSWLFNSHPLFSLGLDWPVSRALILGLLPFTAHYCSHPYLQLNCETLLWTEIAAWFAKVFQFHPQGCSLSRDGLGTVALQRRCSAIPSRECWLELRLLPWAGSAPQSCCILGNGAKWLKLQFLSTVSADNYTVWRASKEPVGLEQKNVVFKSSSVLSPIGKAQCIVRSLISLQPVKGL